MVQVENNAASIFQSSPIQKQAGLADDGSDKENGALPTNGLKTVLNDWLGLGACGALNDTANTALNTSAESMASQSNRGEPENSLIDHAKNEINSHQISRMSRTVSVSSDITPVAGLASKASTKRGLNSGHDESVIKNQNARKGQFGFLLNNDNDLGMLNCGVDKKNIIQESILASTANGASACAATMDSASKHNFAAATARGLGQKLGAIQQCVAPICEDDDDKDDDVDSGNDNDNGVRPKDTNEFPFKLPPKPGDTAAKKGSRAIAAQMAAEKKGVTVQSWNKKLYSERLQQHQTSHTKIQMKEAMASHYATVKPNSTAPSLNPSAPLSLDPPPKVNRVTLEKFVFDRECEENDDANLTSTSERHASSRKQKNKNININVGGIVDVSTRCSKDPNSLQHKRAQGRKNGYKIAGTYEPVGPQYKWECNSTEPDEWLCYKSFSKNADKHFNSWHENKEALSHSFCSTYQDDSFSITTPIISNATNKKSNRKAKKNQQSEKQHGHRSRIMDLLKAKRNDIALLDHPLIINNAPSEEHIHTDVITNRISKKEEKENIAPTIKDKNFSQKKKNGGLKFLSNVFSRKKAAQPRGHVLYDSDDDHHLRRNNKVTKNRVGLSANQYESCNKNDISDDYIQFEVVEADQDHHNNNAKSDTKSTNNKTKKTNEKTRKTARTIIHFGENPKRSPTEGGTVSGINQVANHKVSVFDMPPTTFVTKHQQSLFDDEKEEKAEKQKQTNLADQIQDCRDDDNENEHHRGRSTDNHIGLKELVSVRGTPEIGYEAFVMDETMVAILNRHVNKEWENNFDQQLLEEMSDHSCNSDQDNDDNEFPNSEELYEDRVANGEGADKNVPNSISTAIEEGDEKDATKSEDSEKFGGQNRSQHADMNNNVQNDESESDITLIVTNQNEIVKQNIPSPNKKTLYTGTPTPRLDKEDIHHMHSLLSCETDDEEDDDESAHAGIKAQGEQLPYNKTDGDDMEDINDDDGNENDLSHDSRLGISPSPLSNMYDDDMWGEILKENDDLRERSRSSLGNRNDKNTSQSSYGTSSTNSNNSGSTNSNSLLDSSGSSLSAYDDSMMTNEDDSMMKSSGRHSTRTRSSRHKHRVPDDDDSLMKPSERRGPKARNYSKYQSRAPVVRTIDETGSHDSDLDLVGENFINQNDSLDSLDKAVMDFSTNSNKNKGYNKDYNNRHSHTFPPRGNNIRNTTTASAAAHRRQRQLSELVKQRQRWIKELSPPR